MSEKQKNKDIITKNESVIFPELQARYVEDGFTIKRMGTGTTGVVYQVSPDEVIKVMHVFFERPCVDNLFRRITPTGWLVVMHNR